MTTTAPLVPPPSPFGTVPPDVDGLYRARAFPGLWLDPTALLAQDARRLAAAVVAGVPTSEHAAFVADLRGRQPTA